MFNDKWRIPKKLVPGVKYHRCVTIMKQTLGPLLEFPNISYLQSSYPNHKTSIQFKRYNYIAFDLWAHFITWSSYFNFFEKMGTDILDVKEKRHLWYLLHEVL